MEIPLKKQRRSIPLTVARDPCAAGPAPEAVSRCWERCRPEDKGEKTRDGLGRMERNFKFAVKGLGIN